jgi:hypothetical protein
MFQSCIPRLEYGVRSIILNAVERREDKILGGEKEK